MDMDVIIIGVIGICSGLLFMLGAVFKWRWLLEGNGSIEKKHNLADEPWYRILTFISGAALAAGGIVLIVMNCE